MTPLFTLSRLTRALTLSTPLACAVLLGACGAGDDNGSAPIEYSVNPSSVTPTSASTDQPFQSPSVAEFYAFGSTCVSTAKGQAVLETANTVTYSDGSASAAHMKAISQFAEASVQTLRHRFGVTAPGNIGFDGQKIRVCAATNGSASQSTGTAGIRTLHIGIPEGSNQTGALVHHELVHLLQAQALKCEKQQYGWERWFNEGMALRVAGQEQPRKDALSSLKSAFGGSPGGTPFGDMDQRSWPSYDSYPGYRLAIDTLLGETGKTDQDLYRFLKQVGETTGCPGVGMNWSSNNDIPGWKTAFDAHFGTDLRGSGALGANFWNVASKYAR